MKEVSKTYLKNRQKVLDLTNQDINLSLENDEQVYIAVFDVPVDSGIVGLYTQTLALVFGLHTHIYWGIGEASTDFEQDKEVMHAMQSVLVSSHQALDSMKKVNDVSYYESDYIRVYFKTRTGIFFKELNEDTRIDQFLKMLMYHVYQTISRKFGTSD